MSTFCEWRGSSMDIEMCKQIFLIYYIPIKKWLRRFFLGGGREGNKREMTRKTLGIKTKINVWTTCSLPKCIVVSQWAEIATNTNVCEVWSSHSFTRFNIELAGARHGLLHAISGKLVPTQKSPHDIIIYLMLST